MARGKAPRETADPTKPQRLPEPAAAAPKPAAGWLSTSQILAVLVLQSSAAALLVSQARAGASWSPQTAVLTQELIKGACCVLLLLRQGGSAALTEALTPSREALKTAVPAILYLFHSNMQYVAASFLDPTTFAVLHQLKILTTALLSVLILGKRLTAAQWAALSLLTAGAAAVVGAPFLAAERSAAWRAQSWERMIPGILAIFAACLSSGLAGVYFEKLLKHSDVSLWARNLQLVAVSSLVGSLGLAQSEGLSIFGPRFFEGYSGVTWLALINNALGGLLVAVVIKHADNILKNFATTCSVLLTSGISATMFGMPLPPLGVLGTIAVVYAVLLYGGVRDLKDVWQVLVPELSGKPLDNSATAMPLVAPTFSIPKIPEAEAVVGPAAEDCGEDAEVGPYGIDVELQAARFHAFFSKVEAVDVV